MSSIRKRIVDLTESASVGDNDVAYYVVGGQDRKVKKSTLFTDPVFTGSFTSPGIDDNASSTQLAIADASVTISPNLIVSGDAAFNTDTLFVDVSENRVGIGTTTPAVSLNVSTSDAVSAWALVSASGTGTAGIALDASNGDFSGSDYAVFQQNNDLSTYLHTALSAGNLYAWAGANSVTNQLVLNTNGGVGIGVEIPLAKLHVDQISTSGAIPVLYLDQADISEEMMEFNTTIGVGNAIEAVGAKALTTTHFIKVTLPGSLTRYIPCGTIA